MNPVLRRIEERTPALVARVVDEMYLNPFWTERFGARGRRFSEQDGQYHLMYLGQALDAREPAILANYAKWVQGVLTSRGMCTRHLDENLERLARAVAEDVPGSTEAVEYLQKAREALVYAEGPGRELQLAAELLCATTVRDLFGRIREFAAAGEPARTRAREDVPHLVSYAADALATNRPELFSAYATFLGGHYDKLGLPKGFARELVSSLGRALSEAKLSGSTAAGTLDMLQDAESALRGQAA